MPRLSRDAVIAEIYAAAAEPDSLRRISDALCAYVETDSAGLWLSDQRGITEISQTADIQESIEPYLGRYIALDPWTAAPKTPGLVYLGSDSVDEAALLRSEFYRDFARHFGMLRPMGLTFSLEPGTVATVALNRSRPHRLLGEDERAVLQDLSVHLRGALMLRQRIEAERETRSAQGAALDAVAFGVVTCDAEGRARTVNAAAAAMEAAGLVRIARDGRALHAATPPQTRALRSLIREAVSGMPGAMRIDGADGTMLSVLVTPTQFESRAFALVTLRIEDAPIGLRAATLSRLFGLSPAQAELCLLLLAGLTFDAAALERGIATSTARSHFLVILARTGTKNLRDLLRLLGSLPQVR